MPLRDYEAKDVCYVGRFGQHEEWNRLYDDPEWRRVPKYLKVIKKNDFLTFARAVGLRFTPPREGELGPFACSNATPASLPQHDREV